eukprot:1123160-Amphidinium_carterae.1
MEAFIKEVHAVILECHAAHDIPEADRSSNPAASVWARKSFFQVEGAVEKQKTCHQETVCEKQ